MLLMFKETVIIFLILGFDPYNAFSVGMDRINRYTLNLSKSKEAVEICIKWQKLGNSLQNYIDFILLVPISYSPRCDE